METVVRLGILTFTKPYLNKAIFISGYCYSKQFRIPKSRVKPIDADVTPLQSEDEKLWVAPSPHASPGKVPSRLSAGRLSEGRLSEGRLGAQGSGLRARGSGFGAQGSGLRAQGSGRAVAGCQTHQD